MKTVLVIAALSLVAASVSAQNPGASRADDYTPAGIVVSGHVNDWVVS